MAVNTKTALGQAIEQAGNADLSHLIHHSDRGSQYCCNDYIALLKSVNANISMTQDYKPTDNGYYRTCQWHHKAGMDLSYEKAQGYGSGNPYIKRHHILI
jgi:transposase InsO family protein